MSKNIKLNETEYSGISEVQLPTTSGGTASFVDVDDATVPSGTLEITANGQVDVYNYAMATVNVPTESGGSHETGTFVGDGTGIVTLPVTSKKRGYAILMNDHDAFLEGDLSSVSKHSVIFKMYDSEFKVMALTQIYDGKVSNINGFVTSSNVISRNIFNDDSVEIQYGIYVAGETFIDGKTYTWVAW